MISTIIQCHTLRLPIDISPHQESTTIGTDGQHSPPLLESTRLPLPVNAKACLLPLCNHRSFPAISILAPDPRPKKRRRNHQQHSQNTHNPWMSDHLFEHGEWQDSGRLRKSATFHNTLAQSFRCNAPPSQTPIENEISVSFPIDHLLRRHRDHFARYPCDNS
jgi:hypothetical protein